MKKLLVLVFIVILTCLQLFSAGAAFAATATDITVEKYTILKNGSEYSGNIYQGDKITLRLNLLYNTAGLSDVFIIIGSGSSFYGVDSNTKKVDNPPAAVQDIDLIYNGTGKDLVITFSYTGGSNETNQTITVKNAVPTDSTPPSPPQDTSKYIPKLNVAGGTTMPVVSAGGTSTVTFPIKNSGSYAARNVIISLGMEDSAKIPYIFDKLNLSQSVDQINPNETKNVAFNFVVLAGAPEGIYAMKLNYQFQNPFNDALSASETVYIKVLNDNTAPELTVNSIAVVPDGSPANGTGTVNLAINLKNMGSLDAKDVKVTLKGLKSGGFTTYNSTDVQYLSKINGRGSSTVTYVLSVPPEMSGGSNELSVKMDYRDEMNNTYSEENQIFIPADGTGGGNPGLVFDKIQLPKGVIAPNREFAISFDLNNTGSGAARNVKVWLTSDKELVSKSLSSIVIDRIDKGTAKKVEFKLFATEDAVTKNYPVALNVEYEDASGNKLTASQYIGVFVENSTGKSMPRIIIDKYAFEPAEVKAGENFNLKVSFQNTSRMAGVSNIKVTVTSDDGTFTPANSSNTFFVENIGMKESVERSLEIYTKPDAEAKSYTLSVNFDYEDDKGNPYSSKETISIPVKQNPRLVTGELSLPPQTFTGQPMQVYLDFYNMGKSTLYNLMVKAEGDFQGQSLSYYVGNFEPGRSDSYDVSIIPNTSGTLKGNVVFSFEDAAGKPSEIRKEFTVEVTEMKQDMMNSPDGKTVVAGPGGKMVAGPGGMMQGQQGGRKFSLLLIIIPVVFIAGIVVFIILRKKHIKRKEMSFDE